MKFRNQRHQELFTQAIRRLDRQNFTLMAVVYLFTADTRLWSMTKQSICYSGVDFSRIRLNNCSVRVYALYSAARDLYFGTDVLILSDLADAQVVPPRVFKVVCNAMAICRVGLDASFDTQVQMYTDMIMMKSNWQMAGIYADEGITGTIAKKRPDFMRMIEDCRKGKIDMIITKSVSRFS